MITITKSTDQNGNLQFDQSVDNIIEQLRKNTDQITVECAEDLFRYLIMPQMMKDMGYEKCENQIYHRTILKGST